MERKVVGTYENIPNTTHRDELTAIENIDQIAQMIDQYQKEIENICDYLTPTTPPIVKEHRK